MGTPAETIRSLNTRIAELTAQVKSLTATYEEYKKLAATRCSEGDVKVGFVCSGGKWVPAGTTPPVPPSECTNGDVKPGFTCVGGEWSPIPGRPGIPIGEPSTIEAPEIIPGVKPPRVPLLTPELAKIPLLPGWIIRDADGNVVAGREADTIEFQEIIPGVTPPRVPQLIPSLEKIPLLPGWTIRNPIGAVVAQGEPLPTVGGETPRRTIPGINPEYRDPCKPDEEGAMSGNGLACYNGKWVFPYMVPPPGGWAPGEPRPTALGAGGTYYERPLEIGVGEELEL